MAIRKDAQPVYDGTFSSVTFRTIAYTRDSQELQTLDRDRLVPDPPVATEPAP